VTLSPGGRPKPFPSDWASAVVLVPLPDDPEYLSAAVAKWTAAGRHVTYVLASRGEAGIDGMPAEQAASVREAEQLEVIVQVSCRSENSEYFTQTVRTGT
jgi:LmbE family N-acetylglucosaminyl deacetylase